MLFLDIAFIDCYPVVNRTIEFFHRESTRRIKIFNTLNRCHFQSITLKALIDKLITEAQQR